VIGDYRQGRGERHRPGPASLATGEAVGGARGQDHVGGGAENRPSQRHGPAAPMPGG
jgi:hypothetical protein